MTVAQLVAKLRNEKRSALLATGDFRQVSIALPEQYDEAKHAHLRCDFAMGNVYMLVDRT